MSGTAAVGNTFASAVTATGLQLDNNFSTVVAYLNDPTNRNNYAADAGATNTVVTTFAPPVTGGYTTGLELTWKWAATPTGGTVLNANGLGNINLVNPDGSALQAGQGMQGSIGKAVYDGTRAIFLAPPSPASKAAMQTATASASFVSPAQVFNHNGVAKAWAQFNGTTTGTFTPSSGYNVANVARTGTGTYSIAFALALSSANFSAVASSQRVVIATISGKTTAGVIVCTDNALPSGPFDSSEVNVVVYGTS